MAEDGPSSLLRQDARAGTAGEPRQCTFLRIKCNRALRHLPWLRRGLQSPRSCWATQHGSKGHALMGLSGSLLPLVSVSEDRAAETPLKSPPTSGGKNSFKKPILPYAPKSCRFCGLCTQRETTKTSCSRAASCLPSPHRW